MRAAQGRGAEQLTWLRWREFDRVFVGRPARPTARFRGKASVRRLGAAGPYDNGPAGSFLQGRCLLSGLLLLELRVAFIGDEQARCPGQDARGKRR